jgi:LysM repeat protein
MLNRFVRFVAFVVMITLLVLPASTSAAPAGDGGSVIHTVRAGETLSQIAAQYQVSVAAIVMANNLKNPDTIFAGQQLAIPSAGAPGAVPPSPAPPSPAPETHWVDRGDTLTTIAAFYRISVAELATANGLPADATLYAGQVLIIPARQQPALAAPTNVVCASYYVAQPGDSLSRIAARYGIDLAALIQSNKLERTVLYIGQQLCIPASGTAAPPSPGSSPAPAYQPAPVPPAYQPPSAAPAYQPPDYQPQSALVTPPAEGAPGYSPVIPAPPAAPIYVMPAGNEPSVIHAEMMWVGSQTNDSADPNGITSLIALTDDQKDLNVVIRSSSGLVSSGTTGQYYEFSWVPNFAFRYIPAGTYQVWIQGQPSKVTTAQVFPGRRTWVEFKWRQTTPDVLQASSTGFTAEILDNTSGDKPLGVASILVIKAGAPGQQIRVTAPGGFEAHCTTGSKPEYGPGACDIGGLNAGTYQVTMDGAGVSLEIYLDGRGTATVAFHPA